MNGLEAELRSLIDEANKKRDEACYDKDLAATQLLSLEGEFAKLTTKTENLTRQLESSEKKLAAALANVENRYREGKAEGKLEAEAAAEAAFNARRSEMLEEFKVSQEFLDIRNKDFMSAGDQIVDLIKKERPEWDLSFLYNPSTPVVDEDLLPSAEGDAEPAAAGGDEGGDEA